MCSMEPFAPRLRRGDLLIGSVVTLATPEIAEIFSNAGLDWLFVDLEHSALGIRDAQAILQAAQPRTACLVRVPALGEVWVKKCLDIGADGIILPQVSSPQQVRQAVALSKYPPSGNRSVGIARAQGYGADFERYVNRANEETALVIQIEHIDAVNGIGDILDVPGIDAVFVGPYDLSASMGRTGQVKTPEVQKAIERVRQAAQIAGLPLGIFGTTASAVEPYIRSGYSLIAVGIDSLLLGDAARDIAQRLR